MTERITFAQLEAVLAKLGFKKSIVPGSHVNYEHPEAGAISPVRLHKAREFASSFALAAVGHDLEVLGVIAGSEFEEMLKTAAALKLKTPKSRGRSAGANGSAATRRHLEQVFHNPAVRKGFFTRNPCDEFSTIPGRSGRSHENTRR